MLIKKDKKFLKNSKNSKNYNFYLFLCIIFYQKIEINIYFMDNKDNNYLL